MARFRNDELFVTLRRWSNLFRGFIPLKLRSQFPSFGRFIPASTSFPKDDHYLLTRDDTHFAVNRSDYVQWRIFYGVRDNALKRARKLLSNGTTVLDIGASCGGFSLRLARFAFQNGYDITIHAFEPNPMVYETYVKNLSLNPDLSQHVTIHPSGLGNETGTRIFCVPPENSGAGRIVQEASDGAIRIQVQRLDDFIRTHPPTSIAFIKMIVEGSEPDVFKGGWDTIKTFKPSIFFEVTPQWYQEHQAKLEDIVDPLRQLGYVFEAEFQNEMMPYHPQKFIDCYQYYLLATPPQP